jgi:hypothetical protein
MPLRRTGLYSRSLTGPLDQASRPYGDDPFREEKKKKISAGTRF